MHVPRYIKEELKLIDKMYFCIYNSKILDKKSMSYGKGRWQVRKWVGNRPKRLNLWNCYGYSDVIFTICKEEMTDMGLVDAGYEEMDRRVITAIRKSNYWKAQWKQKVADMDFRNDRKREQAIEQFDYESKYAAKRVWRAMHEPQVCLPGKEWKI